MEADPGTKPKDKKLTDEQKKNIHTLSDLWDVPESIGIRCNPNDSDSINRFLVESQLSFVLPCGIVFWALFLLLRS
jgi:hypothetical protein